MKAALITSLRTRLFPWIQTGGAALSGCNGRGKTTFLNLLLGKYAYSGTISASVNFEYFPFEVENPDDTPLEIAESIMPDFELWRLTRELNLFNADPGTALAALLRR